MDTKYKFCSKTCNNRKFNIYSFNDGYFFVIEKNSGNILRITKVLNQNKNKIKNIPNFMKRSSIEQFPVGILIGKIKYFLQQIMEDYITINTSNWKNKSSIKLMEIKFQDLLF